MTLIAFVIFFLACVAAGICFLIGLKLAVWLLGIIFSGVGFLMIVATLIALIPIVVLFLGIPFMWAAFFVKTMIDILKERD